MAAFNIRTQVYEDVKSNVLPQITRERKTEGELFQKYNVSSKRALKRAAKLDYATKVHASMFQKNMLVGNFSTEGVLLAFKQGFLTGTPL